MGALALHPSYFEMMCYKKSGMHPTKLTTFPSPPAQKGDKWGIKNFPKKQFLRDNTIIH